MTDNEIIKAMESAIHRYKDATHYVSCIVDINILKNALDLINRQKTENERLKIDLAKCSIRLDNLYKAAYEIKSEAIKEFAERLKSEYEDEKQGRYMDWLMNDVIDNLVKEMTEVETNQRKEDEGK